MAFNRARALEEAQRFIEKGQLKRAAGRYEKVCDADPDDFRTGLRLADLYVRAGMMESAALRYFDIAQRYGRKGEHLKAIATYKQMLRIDRALFPVHLSLARSYRELGLVNDAVAQYQQAVRVLGTQGRGTERLDTIRELLGLDRENVQARVRLAEDFVADGRIQDAIEQLRLAAELLDEADRHEEYVRVAERLLYHKPDDVAVSRRLAEVYLRQQNPQKALPRLQVAYAAQPADVDVLALLGATFEALGQVHKAAAVMKALAAIHDRNGLMEERDEVLAHILDLDPSDEHALSVLRPARPQDEPEIDEIAFDELEDRDDASEPGLSLGTGNAAEQPELAVVAPEAGAVSMEELAAELLSDLEDGPGPLAGLEEDDRDPLGAMSLELQPERAADLDSELVVDGGVDSDGDGAMTVSPSLPELPVAVSQGQLEELDFGEDVLTPVTPPPTPEYLPETGVDAAEASREAEAPAGAEPPDMADLLDALGEDAATAAEPEGPSELAIAEEEEESDQPEEDQQHLDLADLPLEVDPRPELAEAAAAPLAGLEELDFDAPEAVAEERGAKVRPDAVGAPAVSPPVTEGPGAGAAAPDAQPEAPADSSAPADAVVVGDAPADAAPPAPPLTAAAPDTAPRRAPAAPSAGPAGPPPIPPPPPLPLPEAIRGDLQEVDFYLDIDHMDEARGILEDIPAQWASHPEVKRRWERLT